MGYPVIRVNGFAHIFMGAHIREGGLLAWFFKYTVHAYSKRRCAYGEAKKQQQTEQRELTGLERLGLRVSAMINAPKAQLERRVTIHRLDTDTNEAWNGVMELLQETDGLEMTLIEDGAVELRWHQQSDADHNAGEGEIEPVEEEPVA